MRYSGREKKRRETVSEVDFKTFLSLMIVLVPILLITAQFGRIAVLDAVLCDGGSRTDIPVNTRPDNDNKLLLTTIITDSVITIGARSGFLPSITYREFHQYIAQDDRYSFSVEYDPNKEVLHPVTGRAMKKSEILEMYLYATDKNNTVKKAYYDKNNSLMTDSEGNPATSLSKGDTVYTLTNPRRMLIALNMDDFSKKPLSAYDALKCRLSAIKRQYPDVRDANEITIAAENSVKYDKIVQIMDAVKMADYPDISITRLRKT